MGEGSQLKIEIAAHVELAALRELEAQLQRDIVRAQALGRPVEEIAEKERQLAATQERLGQFSFLEKAKGELTEFASKIPGVGAAVNLLNGSFLTAAAGAEVLKKGIDFCVESFHAFELAEARLASLNQALAVTGQYSATTAQQVRDLVTAQKEHGIAASESMPALETLIKLGKTHTDQLGTEFAAVKGFAFLLGSDLPAAAQQWSRALEGNTMMLTRYFGAAAEGLSKEEKIAFYRQRLIESAAAYDAKLQTAEGATKILANATGDLMARFGGLLEKTFALSEGTRELGFIFQSLANELPPVEEHTKKINVQKTAVDDLATAFKNAGLQVSELNLGTGDEFANWLKDLTEKTQNLNSELDHARQLKDQLSEAKEARELADLELQKETKLAGIKDPHQRRLVEAEFDAQRNEVRGRYKKEREDNAVTTDKDKLTNAQNALKLAQDQLDQVTKDRDRGLQAKAEAEALNQQYNQIGQRQTSARDLQAGYLKAGHAYHPAGTGASDAEVLSFFQDLRDKPEAQEWNPEAWRAAQGYFKASGLLGRANQDKADLEKGGLTAAQAQAQATAGDLAQKNFDDKQPALQAAVAAAQKLVTDATAALEISQTRAAAGQPTAAATKLAGQNKVQAAADAWDQADFAEEETEIQKRAAEKRKNKEDFARQYREQIKELRQSKDPGAKLAAQKAERDLSAYLLSKGEKPEPLNSGAPAATPGAAGNPLVGLPSVAAVRAAAAQAGVHHNRGQETELKQLADAIEELMRAVGAHTNPQAKTMQSLIARINNLEGQLKGVKI